jgi:hypothetical protein
MVVIHRGGGDVVQSEGTQVDTGIESGDFDLGLGEGPEVDEDTSDLE